MRFVEPTVLLIMVLAVAALAPVVVFAQDDASGTIASAKQQLVVCYDAARRAESAGANVSSLTSVLIAAGNLLSHSEYAYSSGDLGNARNLAEQCIQALIGFTSEADSLRAAAEGEASFDFFVYFVGSIVGTVVVIFAGLVVWFVVKKRYVPVEQEVEIVESS